VVPFCAKANLNVKLFTGVKVDSSENLMAFVEYSFESIDSWNQEHRGTSGLKANITALCTGLLYIPTVTLLHLQYILVLLRHRQGRTGCLTQHDNEVIVK
jgi:hypothetical protein